MAEAEQQFSIQRLFIKDISFETPGGSEMFKAQWKPQIHLDVNTRNEKLEDDIFEVVLTLTITAKQDDKTAFLVEVQQAGIFLAKGLADDQLRQVMGTVAPNILFPYAREMVDSLVTKGSFPALMLAPINFDALYQQAQQQKAQKQEETADQKH
jgi:preprotein translocase subunit SecB